MTTIATRTVKIGMKHDKPRLWLEGSWLAEAGFERGDKFTMHVDVEGDIRLQRIDDDQVRVGARTVSGKSKGHCLDVPVIDINSSVPFSGPATVRYGIISGILHVTKAETCWCWCGCGSTQPHQEAVETPDDVRDAMQGVK